jgi:hypothetical protein
VSIRPADEPIEDERIDEGGDVLFCAP